MDENTNDPAARAFEDLRGQVALLQRAIEALSAERRSAPDYGPTVKELVDRQDRVGSVLHQILANPMLKLTPAQFGAEMSKATEHLRVADRQAVAAAAEALHRSIGRLDHLVQRRRTTEEERRRLTYVGAAALMAGMMLWSVLPGAIARSLPESWHVPEWMAARTMSADERTAGERLLAVATQQNTATK